MIDQVKNTLRISWHWLAKHFSVIALCLTVPSICFVAWGQRDAFFNFDWQINPQELVAALFLLALAPLFQAVSFFDALRSFGPRPAIFEVILIWTRSFLLRYAPTGALAFVYRVRQTDRLEADKSQIVAATAYEQYAAIQAALTVAVIFFWADGSSAPVWAIGLFSLGLLIMLLARPTLLGGVIHRILTNRGMELPSLLRGRKVVTIISLNIVSWLSVSFGNWLLVESIAPGANVSFLYFSGAFALACVVGIIVPGLPGGIGIREGMIVLLLAGFMSASVATALAISLRIVATLAEFLAIMLSESAFFNSQKIKQKKTSPKT